MLIQICSGARCRSRLRCGVGLLQIFYRQVNKGKCLRLNMDEAERAKTKKADEWMRKKLIGIKRMQEDVRCGRYTP